MARLRFDHIAGKRGFDDDRDMEGDTCDFCHQVKFKKGDLCWYIQDGFGYSQCIYCYIKELEGEIRDIEWIKERNEKIKGKIEYLRTFAPTKPKE